MKERPINFKAWEVRAMRAGRKTQFRRVVNPQPNEGMAYRGVIITSTIKLNDGSHLFTDPVAWKSQRIRCPYGAPGDRLWVREAFLHQSLPSYPPATLYRADGHSDEIGPWKPSVHMPRWASRFDLEGVSVRVERLQDISEEDAKAEGVQRGAVCDDAQCDDDFGPMNFVDGYQIAWESINGPGSWDENPFVWVVEFRQCE